METRIHTLKVSDDSTIVITSLWNGNICNHITVDGKFPNYDVEEMIIYAILEGGVPEGTVLGVVEDDENDWFWTDDGHRTIEDSDITYTVQSIEYSYQA